MLLWNINKERVEFVSLFLCLFVFLILLYYFYVLVFWCSRNDAGISFQILAPALEQALFWISSLVS